MEENSAVEWSLVGAILFGVALLILYFIFIFVEPQIRFGNSESQVCLDKSPERSCYNINLEVCNLVYDNYFLSCQSEVKARISPRKVTSLIGPAVRRCTLRHFDKAVHATRKSEGSSDLCKTFFAELDAPRSE